MNLNFFNAFLWIGFNCFLSTTQGDFFFPSMPTVAVYRESISLITEIATIPFFSAGQISVTPNRFGAILPNVRQGFKVD